MALAIDNYQRQLLYDAALSDLDGIRDMVIEIESGRPIEAQLRRQRHEDELRLLDDLGWSPDDERENFELTIPPERLTRLLGFFYERSLEMLIGQALDHSEPDSGVCRDAEALSLIRDLSLRAVTVSADADQPG